MFVRASGQMAHCQVKRDRFFRWSRQEKSRLADGPGVHAANKGESLAAKHCYPVESGAGGKAGTPTAPSTESVCT